jgi:hypothetical protein
MSDLDEILSRQQSKLKRISRLLDALGVVTEGSDDMAIRVRARLLLTELEGSDPVDHPPVVARAVPGAVDDASGAILNRDLIAGAVSVLRWLLR